MTVSLALVTLLIVHVAALQVRENALIGIASAMTEVSQYDNYRLFEVLQDSDAIELRKEKLKGFAKHLHHEPPSDAWILSYAGKYACVNEGKRRGEEVKKYLIEQGVQKRRIKVVDSGFHDEWAVELWLVIRGTPGPTSKPSVKRQEVQLIKRKSLCREKQLYR